MDLSAWGVTQELLTAFLQVVMIDLTLAGDNAIVIGLAAAGLAKDQRRTAIVVGIAAATALRIVFALLTTTLLQIVGLLLAGGILLLWVCWKMWRELITPRDEDKEGVEALAGETKVRAKAPPKTLKAAITTIVIADVSMSLDNVLAVAGAAHDHPSVLIFGLALSIALMGFAATFIARLLERHRWIAYVGLAVILFVALEMIWRGGHEVWEASGATISENGIELAPSP